MVPSPLAAISRHFNRHLTLSFLVIAISTLNYGFDQNGYTVIQAMDPFINQFGEYDQATGNYILSPSWLSLFNSLNYIGYAFGVVFGSLVSNRWGRRWCMFSMSGHAVVCTIIAVTSKSKVQIMAARILNYIYVGMELAVIPVYQSEIVPSPVRGFAVGSYQFALVFGGFTMNCICRSTSALATNAAWRIPFGIFSVVPTLVMSLIWLIPESPRWLLTKGRVEEAREALYKLRSGAFSDEEIAEEFRALQFALAIEPEQGKSHEIFQGANRKRTAIIVIMNFLQQATGQSFVSSYGAVFVKSIGSVNPFDMTIINSVVNVLMLGVNLCLNDWAGRRPLLLIGALWQAAAIFTMGGLGTAANQTMAIKKATVAMLPIFSGGFCFAWAPLTYVVTTEVTTASVANVVTAFAVNFSLPYMLYAPAELGGRVGFIFGGVAVLSFVFTYFCVPECKGKMLEEIDIMFHDGVPVRKFQSTKVAKIGLESGKNGDEIGLESANRNI
ncbi:sugar transporter [Aspergillus sclerotioniger CBS 115572]|uniref:Sugar transporter n=1 Tax=Aspergillus sclerotioniger CBS 115572 TaxID=1450535 RepID=A0A317X8I4_9EURO|nr:sugar transporter [Aspergillus sclerotioniger CBS 115572]PWY93218.1 sugar transporter [Aspergillus sclerotioniger CBS 115572]